MNALSKTKIICLFVGSLLLVFFPFIVSANTNEHMQLIIDKVRADKKLLVSENMQLTDNEAESFWPVYEKYQNDIISLRLRTEKLIEEYALAYNSTNVTNEAAKKLLDEFISIEESKLATLNNYVPKFREILPDSKVARYIQIENKIDAGLKYEIAAGVPLIEESKK